MQKKRQEETPLWEVLKNHAKEQILSFHMPGHKHGQGAEKDFKKYLGKAVFSIDLTEIPGTDDLHCPEGAIKEAQQLAAEAFGADHSFFLVNGTSCGIQAMLMTICNPGEKIIVPRNVHRSILGGLILTGAWPVYLQPEIEEAWGIAMGVTPAKVAQALESCPGAQGVLLVSPTYYGVVPDLIKIAEIVHQYGKPLLVDEAHGPHLCFHSALPPSSLEAGADLCSQGVHKLIGGMTQASLLHSQGERIDLERLRNSLQILQTTSPSYVLMASLDTARRQMALEGEKLLTNTLSLAQRARERLDKLPGLSCLGLEVLGKPGAQALDLTKLTVNCQGLGLTGWEVESLLRSQYKIQPELSAYNHLLFLWTPGNREEDLERLVEALTEIAQKKRKALPPPKDYWSILPEQICSPREAFFAPKIRLPLKEALGRIGGEMVAPYPPGIPVLAPGERINDQVMACLLDIKEKGLKVQGPTDISLETIVVLKEER